MARSEDFPEGESYSYVPQSEFVPYEGQIVNPDVFRIGARFVTVRDVAYSHRPLIPEAFTVITEPNREANAGLSMVIFSDIIPILHRVDLSDLGVVPTRTGLMRMFRFTHIDESKPPEREEQIEQFLKQADPLKAVSASISAAAESDDIEKRFSFLTRSAHTLAASKYSLTAVSLTHEDIYNILVKGVALHDLALENRISRVVATFH